MTMKSYKGTVDPLLKHMLEFSLKIFNGGLAICDCIFSTK